jgi:small subunit ribosomal protein S16
MFCNSVWLGMIKLRLKRFGKKREASFRIVAMQSTSRRDGRALEELGFYNPRTKEVKFKEEAIARRLQQGAQPTDTVRRLLEKASLLAPTPALAKRIAASEAGVAAKLAAASA